MSRLSSLQQYSVGGNSPGAAAVDANARASLLKYAVGEGYEEAAAKFEPSSELISRFKSNKEEKKRKELNRLEPPGSNALSVPGSPIDPHAVRQIKREVPSALQRAMGLGP